MPNALWLFPHFDVYIQTPDDPMHMVNLGMWIHILEVVFVDMKNNLLLPSRVTKSGKEKNLLTEKQLAAVSTTQCSQAVTNLKTLDSFFFF